MEKGSHVTLLIDNLQDFAIDPNNATNGRGTVDGLAKFRRVQ